VIAASRLAGLGALNVKIDVALQNAGPFGPSQNVRTLYWYLVVVKQKPARISRMNGNLAVGCLCSHPRNKIQTTAGEDYDGRPHCGSGWEQRVFA